MTRILALALAVFAPCAAAAAPARALSGDQVDPARADHVVVFSASDDDAGQVVRAAARAIHAGADVVLLNTDAPSSQARVRALVRSADVAAHVVTDPSGQVLRGLGIDGSGAYHRDHVALVRTPGTVREALALAVVEVSDTGVADGAEDLERR